jgi:hypothetical protein
MFCCFPFPRRDVTYQTVSGREYVSLIKPEVFPFPSWDSHRILLNHLVFLFTDRSFPGYSSSTGGNSSKVFDNSLVYLFPAWNFPLFSVVGKMTTFDLWPRPLGGGAWGAGTNIWHPETPASYESLPATLATQIPTLWILTSGGRGRGGALILDRCRAFDLFASVDAHLCLFSPFGQSSLIYINCVWVNYIHI